MALLCKSQDCTLCRNLGQFFLFHLVVHGYDALPYFLLLLLGRDLFRLPSEPSVIAAMASRGWRKARPLLLDNVVLFARHGVVWARDPSRDVISAGSWGNVDLISPCGAGDGVLRHSRLHKVDVRGVFSRAWKIFYEPGCHSSLWLLLK